jgi:hypothetical protein
VVEVTGSIVSAHDLTTTIDCRTPGCRGVAGSRTGPDAYCRSCQVSRRPALGQALALDAEVDFDAWKEQLRRAVAIAGAARWRIGELLAYGEFRFGEKYRFAIDELGLTFDRVRDWTFVARLVPPAVRRPDLSWSHHRLVASLPANEQDHLEQVLDDVADTPPAIAVRYELEHIARHAAAAADRLEQLRRPPIRVRRRRLCPRHRQTGERGTGRPSRGQA